MISRKIVTSNLVLVAAILTLIAIVVSAVFSIDKFENGFEYTPSYHLQIDEFSDADVATGGANFNKYGYLKNNLFPNLKGANGKVNDFIYMGYPSLPFVVMGLLLKVGLTIYQIKIIYSIIMLCSAVLLSYSILKILNTNTQNRFSVFVVILGSLCTSWFWDNLGALHQRPLGILLLAAMVFAAYKSDLRFSRYFMIGAAFLIANISYEYYFLTLLYITGLVLLATGDVRKTRNIALWISIGLLAGFLTHVGRSLITESEYSLVSALKSRVVGVETLNYLTPNWGDIVESIKSILEYNYGVPLSLLVALMLWSVHYSKGMHKIGAILIISSGLAWAVLMRQHFYVHFHVMPFHVGWLIFSLATIFILKYRTNEVVFVWLCAILMIQVSYLLNTNSRHVQWGALKQIASIKADNEDWHKMSNRFNLVDGIINNSNFWTVGNDCLSTDLRTELEIDYYNIVQASVLEIYIPIFGSDNLSFIPDSVELSLFIDKTNVFDQEIAPIHSRLVYSNNRDSSMVKLSYLLGSNKRFDRAVFNFKQSKNGAACKKPVRVSEVKWK